MENMQGMRAGRRASEDSYDEEVAPEPPQRDGRIGHSHQIPSLEDPGKGEAKGHHGETSHATKKHRHRHRHTKHKDKEERTQEEAPRHESHPDDNIGEPSHSMKKHRYHHHYTKHMERESGNKDSSCNECHQNKNTRMSQQEYEQNGWKLSARNARAGPTYINEPLPQKQSAPHYKSRGKLMNSNDQYNGAEGPLQMPDQRAPSVAALSPTSSSRTGASAASSPYKEVKKSSMFMPLPSTDMNELEEFDVPVDKKQRGGPKWNQRSPVVPPRPVSQTHPGAIWEGDDIEQGEGATVMTCDHIGSSPDSYNQEGLISAHLVEDPVTVSAVPSNEVDKWWSSQRNRALLIASLGIIIVGLVTGLVVGMTKDDTTYVSAVVPGCVGAVAVSWGDPHFVTFDNFEYDCQGEGDFILVHALNETFEVQGRFAASSDRLVSTIEGIAIAGGAQTPRIELILPDAPSVETSTVNGCPLDMYINGERHIISSESDQNDAVTVDVSDNRVNVAYSSSGATVTVTVMQSSSGLSSLENGCYLNTFVCLPESMSSLRNVVGLMGSPNNNISDDWMNPEGYSVELPSTVKGQLYETAYEYCMENWCVRNSADSLFTYEDSSSFIAKCDAPYPGSVDYETSSEELQALCGDNVACLIDGIIGSAEDAESALQTMQELESARGNSQTPTVAPTSSSAVTPTEPMPSPTIKPTESSPEPTPEPVVPTPSSVTPSRPPTTPTPVSKPPIVASADNDSCENAAGPLPVDGTIVTGSNVNAKENGPLCDKDYVGPGVWCTFVGTGRRVAVSTCTDRTDFDTVLAVYSTSDDTCSSLSCLGINDEGYGPNNWCPVNGRADSVTVETLANNLYYMLVIGDGYGVTGNFGLLAYDETNGCGDATGPLPVDGSITTGSNVDARMTGPICGKDYVGPGVWYTFVGTGKRVAISTCTDRTDIDTVLAVYSTSDDTCGSLSCIDVNDEGYSPNNWCPVNGRADSVTVETLANNLYYVLVIGDGYGVTGNFGLLAYDETNGCGDATGPLPVDGSVTAGSNVNARMTGPICGKDHVGPGVWYTFVGTGRRVAISTCTDRTDIDTVLAVYSTSDDTCGSLSCIDANDEGYSPNNWCPVNGRADHLNMDTLANNLYYVVVIGDGYGVLGNFGLLAYDETNGCVNATGPLPVDGSVTVGSNVDARMTGPICGKDYVGPGVWYTFVGTGKRVVVSTCTDKTDFDTVLAVYSTSDDTCGSLSCIDVNDEGYSPNNWCLANGRADSVTVDTLANNLYYVLVIGDGYGVTGNFGLVLTTEAAGV